MIYYSNNLDYIIDCRYSIKCTFPPSPEPSFVVPSFEAKQTAVSEKDLTRTLDGKYVSRDPGLLKE